MTQCTLLLLFLSRYLTNCHEPHEHLLQTLAVNFGTASNLSCFALAQEFMAATVVLEHMVRREWLKPYWRLWAFPAPSCDECGAIIATRCLVPCCQPP